MWNSATNSLTSVISGLNAPKGVAVNVQGTLVYIGDSGNQRILVWNVTSSRIVTRLGGTSNYPSTVGMKLDAAGNLWVADITRNAVVVWNASTNVSSVAVAGLNGPRDLQVSSKPCHISRTSICFVLTHFFSLIALVRFGFRTLAIIPLNFGTPSRVKRRPFFLDRFLTILVES